VLDIESFAAHVVACYQRCWLIAAAVTDDRAEADDIVQEASIIAWRKLADFTLGTNFAAWIGQIVRLTALNHVKRTSRRNMVVTDPAKIDQVGAADEAGAKDGRLSFSEDGCLLEHQTDFDDEVLFALHEISDIARACLLLRVVQQLPYDDIAQTLQIPAGTVMSHVHRAKQSIRRHLKDRKVPPAKCADNHGKE
jgi:RNA polymerase sigma-70 factor, ECF subfamily